MSHNDAGRDPYGRTQAEIIAYLVEQLNSHYADEDRDTWFSEDGQEHTEPNPTLREDEDDTSDWRDWEGDDLQDFGLLKSREDGNDWEIYDE